MKALVLEAPGHPPRLALHTFPRPSLGPHDVLVKVAACGVCYHDILVMRGVLRRGVKPRVVLGHEIAGTVEEVGQLVFSLVPGDKVVSLLTEPCGWCLPCTTGKEHRCLRGTGIGHGGDGGFADYVKLSELALVRLSPEADVIGACLLACPIGVALHALRDAAGLRAGETVLVTAAGGGVGTHAVQLARALGARVLAQTTSPQKEEALRTLGADQVLVTPDLAFGDLALAFTEDEGCSVVLNIIGADAFAACWRALAQFGRLVLVGELRGGSISLSPAEVIFKDARIIGVAGVSRAQVADAARLVQGGRIRPVIARTLPLSVEGVLEAYRLLTQEHPLGRVVLVPE
ncbi:MAG: alcohol dehydrogenase catalytic domain-containing protein [Dehalococcoidia bacterium]|nr:alcohol dehydrogenase catalytic domain-containing protein [Dehalococcoidia bacterium]MDW8119195.1 alcohol dehydrogenase catalytic domain-containing protein [Chloroflexota bacterium]